MTMDLRGVSKVCWDLWLQSQNFESLSQPKHGNGKAELAVKTAKALLRKNKNGDQYMALLNHRNTPSQSIGTSPAQRIFIRRTGTFLPTSSKLLKPKQNLKMDGIKLSGDQQKQQKNFNKRAKDLPPLKKGDTVVIQPFTLGKKEWGKGTIIAQNDRSYNVEAIDSTVHRRNRVHLKKTANQRPDIPSDDSPPEVPPNSMTPTCGPAVPPKQPLSTPVAAVPKPAVTPLKQPAVLLQSSPGPEPTGTSPSKIPVCSRFGRKSKPFKLKDFVYDCKWLPIVELYAFQNIDIPRSRITFAFCYWTKVIPLIA